MISRKTAHRVLLKPFTGNVLDIAFALSDDVYLAAVDETGSLYVHSFIMEGDCIKYPFFPMEYMIKMGIIILVY